MTEPRSSLRRTLRVPRASVAVAIASAVLPWLVLGARGLAQEQQAPYGAAAPATVIYVAPNGSDAFSGGLAETNAGKTDGPLASLSGARDKVRGLKNSGPVTVYLRGGDYPVKQTVVFGVDDSTPVTYASYPGEQAVIDGGMRITGWQATQVNGHDAWAADLPGVKAGKWYFRELFVDGRRASRTRLPKGNGYYKIVGPDLSHQLQKSHLGVITNAFVCEAGQINGSWKNMADVDLVLLHFWCEERSAIASYDPDSKVLVMSRLPSKPMGETQKNPHARFYVENVFEELSEPGEWYLDRPAGRLYYIPRAGEDMAGTQIVAPRVTQLIQLVGKPADNKFVESIRFQNLTFCNTDWNQPAITAERYGKPDMLLAGDKQSASFVPGAIQFIGARSCAIEDCHLQHMGWFAVELGDGCSGNRIVGNDMSDLGAGGVKINGSDAKGPVTDRTGGNRITDNHIHGGGRAFPSAAGILSMHSAGNIISHNEVDDFFYTGISVGWVWGFAESVSRNNLVEKNHIHNIGQGVLSDMGGIYTIGNQTGTIVRGNLIHDVSRADYGAEGIYPDEGSSGLLVENNICYDVGDQTYSQHFGHDNIVRNNIFAFGKAGLVGLGKGGDPNNFTMERNLLITDGPAIYRGGYAYDLKDKQFATDTNLLWNTTGPLSMVGQNFTPLSREGNQWTADEFTLDQWHDLGQDLHSIVADPGFKDAAHRDFTLSKDSPALALGFKPIDLSDVGPRVGGKRD